MTLSATDCRPASRTDDIGGGSQEAPAPQRDECKMLTLKQLAERWQMSTRHIRREVQSGTVPKPVRFGRCLRWPLLAIEQAEAEWSRANDDRNRKPR